MMSYMFFQMVMMVMVSGFGGGDALDFMTAEGYWRAKGVTVTADQLKADAAAPGAVGDISALVKDLASPEFKTRDAARQKIEAMGPGVIDQLKPLLDAKDDEVAEAAKEIIETLSKGGQERAVRRLMAIRTLGERKEASAVAVLQEAAGSKDQFVAEYAATALAKVQGKPLPARTAPTIADDVWLLPAEVSIVGQMSAVGGQSPMTLDRLIETYLSNAMGAMGGPEGAKPDPKIIEEQKREALGSAYKGLLGVLDMVGNVRLTGLTLGLSADIGERDGGRDGGHAIIIVRGLYSRDAIISALKSMGGQAKDVSEEYGVPALDMHSVLFLLPSNEMAIVVAGPNAEEIARGAGPLKAALKGKKGTLADSPLAKDIKAAQAKGGMAWAILKPNKAMKKEITWFAPFDTIMADAKVGADRKVACTFVGTTGDEKRAKETLEMMEGDVKTALVEMRRIAEHMPAATFAIRVLESVKVEAKGATVTVTGKVDTDLTAMMSTMFGFAMPMTRTGPGRME